MLKLDKEQVFTGVWEIVKYLILFGDRKSNPI